VPIIVRGKAYGNLYVTDKQGADEFSAADEDVAMMLASQAGIAIENAHTVQALRDAQEELLRREKLALLGQLAGSASHELRNPLGVIKNSLYYLRLVLPEEPRARKHLDILEREVATASRIVGDLLDFARIKTPARGPASLDALVGEVLDRTSAPKGVTRVRELAAGLPPVEVNRLHIQQILTNLITNAFQAMPEGGRLTVATHRDPGGAAVSVTDTGTGISPDLLDKIFLPLFTTKVKGIGLGLALARDLASANRAVIEVDSEPGRGSRFTLRFATPGGD
jgi:signal transduction histidine kinase